MRIGFQQNIDWNRFDCSALSGKEEACEMRDSIIPPGPIRQFTDRMTGEGQRIEDREHRRQVLIARDRSCARGYSPWSSGR